MIHRKIETLEIVYLFIFFLFFFSFRFVAFSLVISFFLSLPSSPPSLFSLYHAQEPGTKIKVPVTSSITVGLLGCLGDISNERMLA